MKLREIIHWVDKSDTNSENASYSGFCKALGLSYDDYNYDLETLFQNKIKGYYLIKWWCTDQPVGHIVYF
jgi:hypothetical protein